MPVYQKTDGREGGRAFLTLILVARKGKRVADAFFVSSEVEGLNSLPSSIVEETKDEEKEAKGVRVEFLERLEGSEA